MSIAKTLAAGLAAAGLVLSQPLLAQDSVDNVPVDEMGVPRAAQPLVFLLGIIALAVVAGLLFEDSDDRPTSP